MLTRCKTLLLLLVVACVSFAPTEGYSAQQDAKIIAEYRRELALNHAKIARQLVHRTNWASVGSLSTNAIVKDYPMVNIISIDDSDATGNSTGHIHFLLTDLDFTGPDWQNNNKVTFLFSDEQTMRCKSANKDPMEPTCARAIISGQVKKFSQNDSDFAPAMNAFVLRHPAATKWMKSHTFYLCELAIRNIFVLDFYGGPHQVNASDYYAIKI